MNPTRMIAFRSSLRPHSPIVLLLAVWMSSACFSVTLRAAYEVPGDPSGGDVVLRGGTVHSVTGPVIENGYVLIRDGKIAEVGELSESQLPEGVEVIDTADRHIYPGLIDSDTALGLVEIEAVRATVDTREVGSFNSNVHAQTAFNPDSELIPVARSSGVLLALSVPRGPFVVGLSSLMELDGWQADEMALLPVAGLHVRWPAAVARHFPGDPDAPARDRERQQQVQELVDAFRDARSHQRLVNHSRPISNLRLEAFHRVIEREIPLMVHADGAREIQEAVAFAERENIRLIIVGGYDAPVCADLLKLHGIPVIVTGTQRLPRRRNSPVHEAFTVPARLQAAGVQYGIAGDDRFSASNVRNLTEHVGTAIAHGLTEEQAVRAMTLSPAEILGVADRVGSLEPGKDATLIVTTGVIFASATEVERAWIQGRSVDLDNRHRRLWRKYQVKYQRLAQQGPLESPDALSMDSGATRIPPQGPQPWRQESDDETVVRPTE